LLIDHTHTVLGVSSMRETAILPSGRG